LFIGGSPDQGGDAPPQRLTMGAVRKNSPPKPSQTAMNEKASTGDRDQPTENTLSKTAKDEAISINSRGYRELTSC
jgi:hypothetical protein